jgi:hypothetical protein
MSEYGLATWDANGVQEIGPASFTMRVSLSTLVTLGNGTAFATFNIAGCTPENTIAVVVPIGPYQNGQSTIQFEPEVLNGAVRVWGGHRTASQGLFGVGTQRLIVLRFK